MRPRYRFVFTGFRAKNADERAHLVNKIQHLGGIYYESDHFKSNCTHVVCARLCRSEKFLCACAAGIWVVTPEYIEKSFAAKKWLKEEDFEWKFADLPANADDALVDLCRAPRRSRQFVAWQNGKGQFVGRTFLLFISEQEKRNVYSRILVAGGAKVRIGSPAVFDFDLVASEEVKFVLVTRNSSDLRPIFRLNVRGVSTDYIRNYLLKKSPPDVSEFDITSYVPNSDAYYQVGLSNSPLKQVLTQPPSNSAFRKTYSTLRSTGAKKEKASPKLVPIVIRENMEHIKEKNKRNCDLSTKHNQQIQPNIRTYFSTNCEDSSKIRPNHTAKKRKSKANPNSDQNPAKRRILFPILNGSDPDTTETRLVSPAKPKTEPKDQKPPEEILQMQKLRAEITNSRFKNHWKHKITHSEEKHNVSVYPVSCFIESYGADQNWRLTIGRFSSLISPCYVLPAKIVRTLIDTILLDGPCEAAASAMYSFLSRMLRALPPHDYGMREWYLSVLEDGPFSGSWSLVSRVLRVSLTSAVGRDRFSHTLFLHFLESLLEKDFARFIQRSTDMKKDLKSPAEQPIIVRLLWGTKSALSFNNNCLDLLKHLVASITNSAPYTTILVLQKLTALMLESARLSEAQDGVVGDVPCSAIELVRRLAELIQSEEMCRDNLVLMLDTMELGWSRMVLARMLLDMSWGSASGDPGRFDRRLTLDEIVNYYMKLVPRQDGGRQHSARTTSNEHTTRPAPDETTQFPPEKSKHVNRRNCKGETPLHIACIRNRIESVQQLLAHPHVDVNAVDHAGWTPLHEACNRGNIDCVRLLLQFSSPRIDIMAKNMDNITPLHDAVVNNHIEIAELLLQRGGQILLHQRDNENRLPLNCARSDAMRTILLNFNENANPTPKFDTAQVENYVTLVFHLLRGYLDTWNLKETSGKFECASISARGSVVDDDSRIYEQLDDHVTEFARHARQLLTSPTEIVLLDLFKLVSF